MSRHNRKRTCRGKVRYRDEREADRALHTLHNYSEADRVPIRKYYCDACHGVHVTAMRKWTDPTAITEAA